MYLFYTQTPKAGYGIHIFKECFMMLKLMDCVRNRIECKREHPMQTKFTTFSSVEREIGGNTYLDKMIVKVTGLGRPFVFDSL